MREDIPQALRGQRNVVFGNIEKIYEFHSGYFLRALEAFEMRPFAIGSIFLRYVSVPYLIFITHWRFCFLFCLFTKIYNGTVHLLNSESIIMTENVTEVVHEILY